MTDAFRLSLGTALVVAVAGPALAAPLPAHLHTFDNPTNFGEATIGNDLTVSNTNSTIASVAGISAGDGAASVGIDDYFGLAHDFAPNGGSTAYVNEYTLLYDIFLPTATDGTWRSLLQTSNTYNGSDGDYFLRNSDGAVGLNAIGYTSNDLVAGNWYRVVFSADIGEAVSFQTTATDASGTSWTYDHGTQALDGRHSLYSTANDNIAFLFADNNGDDAELHVSSFAMWDSTLTAAEAVALGAPGTVIPEPASAALAGVGLMLIARRRRA